MRIDVATLSPKAVYNTLISVITPRPIAWVSTVGLAGDTNLAPFSFFMGVTALPPTLAFSCVNRRDGSKKDTITNIEKVPEFVVNVSSFSNREAVHDTSAELPYGESEIAAFGLTAVASETVKPPRVQEALVQLECKLHKVVSVGQGPLAANLIIGEVLLVHAKDEIFDQAGLIDPERLDTIGRMGGSGYVRTTDRFDLKRPRAGR